jgi:predicted Zn finger-like uncharacterized protein
MKFVCDGCQTRYSIADEKVRQRILRIRCKTCGHVITVQSGEVISSPQDASARLASGVWAGAGASSASAAGPSSGLSRPPAGHREWFVAVDGKEQGPLGRSDAAKIIVSLKPEQSVRVWKEGMDGWKRPKDVAIIAQEISDLKRSPLGPPADAPTPAPRAGSSSAPRSAPSSGVPAPGSRPKPLATGSSGSGPKLPQPGSGLKLSQPAPGSGPKAVPPPIPGSAPKAAPRLIPGSGPKAVPPPIPGSEPKARPPGPGPGAQFVTAGGSSSSVPLHKGPALPGVTPVSAGHATPAVETEFDKAPTTRPEKRPSAVRAVAVPGTQVPAIPQPTARRASVTDDEFDQAQKTPPSSRPLPPVVASARDGHDEKNLPVRPSGSLFANVALLPPEPWRAPHAESGLSKLAALTRRYRHLKYVAAAGVVVVLVILVILLSWRAESGKAVPSASQPATRAPEVPPLGHVEPLPQNENTVAPGPEPKGRTGARAASKRPAVHSAGSSVKAAAVGEDPFEGPSRSSHLAERPVPVVTPDQSHRSRSGASGGAMREVSQSQLGEFVRSKENQAGIRTCYERALKRDSRLRTGRLDITVSVGASGIVQNVQVHGPSDFLIIQDCIKNAIRHWHFPANVEEYATSFPFIMQGG